MSGTMDWSKPFGERLGLPGHVWSFQAGRLGDAVDEAARPYFKMEGFRYDSPVLGNKMELAHRAIDNAVTNFDADFCGTLDTRELAVREKVKALPLPEQRTTGSRSGVLGGLIEREAERFKTPQADALAKELGFVDAAELQKEHVRLGQLERTQLNKVTGPLYKTLHTLQDERALGLLNAKKALWNSGEKGQALIRQSMEAELGLKLTGIHGDPKRAEALVAALGADSVKSLIEAPTHNLESFLQHDGGYAAFKSTLLEQAKELAHITGKPVEEALQSRLISIGVKENVAREIAPLFQLGKDALPDGISALKAKHGIGVAQVAKAGAQVEQGGADAKKATQAGEHAAEEGKGIMKWASKNKTPLAIGAAAVAVAGGWALMEANKRKEAESRPKQL